jgi:class 3 adenylate cyclase
MNERATQTSLVQVARILKNFAEASQFQRGRDGRLRDALSDVLEEVGADAFVMRVGIDGFLLGTFDYSLRLQRDKKDEHVKRVERVANDISGKGIIYECYKDQEIGVEYLFCFLDFDFRTETGRYVAPRKPEFFCFMSGLRKDEGTNNPRHKKRWTKIINHDSKKIFVNDRYRDAIESYCRAIQLAILRRAEGDSIFPIGMSQRFWNAAEDFDPVDCRLRPWDLDASGKTTTVLTASLSFDLRSSTFAMDQAIDKKFHADWLEGMVIILRNIAHWHQGVFDKFTGDGVLAHFPVDSFEGEDIDSASDRAVLNSLVCAWDMIRAVAIYTDHLVPNLALWKPSFGSSVGMAFDDALWSVDRVGNPIVVGRGVVHACRLSDGPAGTVQVSNAVFARL